MTIYIRKASGATGIVSGYFTPSTQSERLGLYGDCPVAIINGERQHLVGVSAWHIVRDVNAELARELGGVHHE